MKIIPVIVIILEGVDHTPLIILRPKAMCVLCSCLRKDPTQMLSSSVRYRPLVSSNDAKVSFEAGLLSWICTLVHSRTIRCNPFLKSIFNNSTGKSQKRFQWRQNVLYKEDWFQVQSNMVEPVYQQVVPPKRSNLSSVWSFNLAEFESISVDRRGQQVKLILKRSSNWSFDNQFESISVNVRVQQTKPKSSSLASNHEF